ncbi:succinate dehydrogenase [Rhodococcus sp. ACPA4]|uniref:succinate dehydrogenase cytochrome b subunit n=1 Tax=Rhodococcus sp. ACPA4 TaxID=2028571 RepID=UPI000BB14AA1|nr:succinate dehydrogenase cytochrome b subunit [Rhodococcus sp. ACPA4]PBC43357.1 succinate dehydrogenase [Rhodococcus sp. ACPA4]
MSVPTRVPHAGADSTRSRLRPSNVTCKILMAVTGLIFAAFVVVHMIGNLKVYTGAEHFDDYAHWLRTVFEPFLPYEGMLWILRIVLLVSLIAHVWCAWLLTLRARRARGPFRRKGLGLSSFTARTMPVTGAVLLLFIVFHILDLTTGTRPIGSTEYEAATRSQSYAYDNLVASFERPAVAAFYILAMALLAMHLAHGLWSAVNDLGVTGQRFRQVAVALAGIIALVVMVGNMSIPIAVLTGLVSKTGA